MTKKRLLAMLAALLVLGGCLAAFSALGESLLSCRGTVTISREEYDYLLSLEKYDKLDEVLQYIEAMYYKEPDEEQMLDYAIQGMLAALEDPYTFYYDEDNWDAHQEDESGEYYGIGIQLLGNYEEMTVTITRVFKDTPALAAGLRKGDIIVRVDDLEVNTESMQAAVDIMRGEVGGTVEVEVYRNGEYLTFKVTRAPIRINYVDYMMLDQDVGYVALYQFSTAALISDFNKAMDTLEQQGAKSIILDLRDNPGGWVDDAVNVADRFLDHKLVVYSATRFEERTDERYTQKGADDIPLILLVNGNSASSSEILSGALKDYGRATLVGTQTFGKGIMQYVFPLSDEVTGMQFTVCEYFTPLGNSVHGIGIAPDIEVELPEELEGALLELGDMSDLQLQAAWEAAVKAQEQ